MARELRPIPELAAMLGVSHRDVDNITQLNYIADAFQDAGVTRLAKSLLRMKAFDGRSLLDLVAAGKFVPEYVQTLISEAQAMDAAYSRSGLAQSKAAPSDDWRAELSIPGSTE